MRVDTAELPTGWRDRLVSWNLRSSRPADPRFIERHALVVGKLVAGRDKDFAFSASLIDARLVDVETLLVRAEMLPTSSTRVIAWLQAYRRRSGGVGTSEA